MFTSLNDEDVPTPLTMKEASEQSVSKIHNCLNEKLDRWLPTGLRDFDGMTYGFHPGELSIIGGRPQSGKTALAAQIAIENGTTAIDDNSEMVNVLVFNLESKGADFASRAISILSGVDPKRIRDRVISASDQQKLADAVKRLQKSSIKIVDSPDLRMELIRESSRREHKQRALGLVIVDGLHLIKGGDPRHTREQQIAEIARELKFMAKELDVPVLALSQLIRGGERELRPPILSDLRDSGAIEENADNVFLLYDPSSKRDNEDIDLCRSVAQRKLYISKQRNSSAIGDIDLTLDLRTGRFMDFDYNRKL